VHRPEICELDVAGGVQFFSSAAQGIGADREDEAGRRTLPAEAVASAGRDENQRARRSLFNAVAAGAPPLEVGVAGELEMHAELMVLMLRNFRWANGMPFEKHVSPRLRYVTARLSRCNQRDEFVVAQYGNSAWSGGGHILTMHLCPNERKQFAARIAYRAEGGEASLE